MATVLNTTFRLKRGTEARWAELNPILDPGEPGFVYDKNRLKIGDGETHWNDLPYIDGKSTVINYASLNDFPLKGDPNAIYKASGELSLYQFNVSTNSYEKIGGNNTTYDIIALEKGEGDSAETYGIQIITKENGTVSGDPIIIDFDVHTKSEADAITNDLSARIQTLENKEDKDTIYSIKTEEKILKLENTEFSTVASLKYLPPTETENAKIQLLGIDNILVSEIDATPFIKDGMLEDVTYNAETNTITFIWNTLAGSKTDTVVLSDIIEPYTNGVGLSLSNNEFAVKIATDSETFLTVDTNGLKLSGIQNTIDTVKAEAENLYATKAYIGEFSKEGEYANIDTIIGYINKKDEETLAAAQGGSSETAASVKLQLDNYKSENDAKVATNTGAIETINEKLDTIENNIETNISKHETRITTLENNTNQHISEYTALKDIVDEHTEAITKKAEQTVVDGILSKVSTNEAAIKTINETTLPAMNTEIGKKANTSDVYTKTEIGIITEGKTIVQMIADAQAAATYNDSEVRNLITAEETRALAAEKVIDGRLKNVETFFATIDTPDEVIDTLAEIVKYIEDDKSAASGMLTNISANTSAIAEINNSETGILAQAKSYADNKIAAIPVAGALLGLVKSSEDNNSIKVAEDGTMSINKVSVNKLYVESGDELVLNGGSAI